MPQSRRPKPLVGVCLTARLMVQLFEPIDGHVLNARLVSSPRIAVIILETSAVVRLLLQAGGHRQLDHEHFLLSANSFSTSKRPPDTRACGRSLEKWQANILGKYAHRRM